jgi:hypothetical protein
LTALRKAWILKPEVFTEDLFQATFVQKHRSDNWPEVVEFLSGNSERHKDVQFAKYVCVFCDTNVDGVQLFETGKRQAVTVLARISGFVNDRGDYFIFSTMPVFLVGIFIGTEKPLYDDVLRLLVKELLARHPGRCSGFEVARTSRVPARFLKCLAATASTSRPWPDETFPDETSLHPSIYVALDRISADGPARSDLAGTPGHNGFWSLPRCRQRGEYVKNAKGKRGHMEYKLIHCAKKLRTDSRWESYKKAIKPFQHDAPAVRKKMKVSTAVTFEQSQGQLMKDGDFRGYCKV